MIDFTVINDSLKPGQAVFVLGRKPNGHIGILHNFRINHIDIFKVLGSHNNKLKVPRFKDFDAINYMGLRDVDRVGFRHVAWYVYKQDEKCCLCIYILSESPLTEGHLKFFALKTARLL